MKSVHEVEVVPRLLLTPEEAAQALGIGRTKLYALLRSGRLLSVRLDGSRRVPVAALTDFVAQLTLGELRD
jgi:excisionase family DNA binding protein